MFPGWAIILISQVFNPEILIQTDQKSLFVHLSQISNKTIKRRNSQLGFRYEIGHEIRARVTTLISIEILLFLVSQIKRRRRPVMSVGNVE